MSKYEQLTVLCYVTFMVLFVNGTSVSPEKLYPREIAALNFPLINDFNLTNIAIALRSDHPHTHLSVIELVRLYNYNIEVHTVQTSDGYILELHRITGHNMRNPNANGKPVAFLQHGLLCSSMDWVLAGPDKGFGFILADAGYDVWLGNVRGSLYSRKHVNYTVEQPEYWNFDWHEMGIYDLPAMIDYILETSENKKLYYVGHSQGSTAFFVMASSNPAYNDKIHAMFSLAPVAYCSKMFSPIFQALARFSTPLKILSKLIGIYEFSPSDEFFTKFSSALCRDNSIMQPVCLNVLFMITGYNINQFDTALLPAILAHVPAGSGVNQFLHYAQIIRSGHFRQFDHGLVGNMMKYGSFTPPAYNLQNVTAPISLHYSVNDWLSDPMDVEKLYSKLPNPIGRFRVVHNKFNHLDYLWAKDVKPLLYSKIMNIMARYKD